MKLISYILIILIIPLNSIAREKGETEITTEDGIEVFQNDKYYLLKKNVKINSDDFKLNAENVKINFDKNLYDIVELNAKGNVNFKSSEFDINGSGENLIFKVKTEVLKVEGDNSELTTKDIKMSSNGFIEVNNKNGNFSLRGENSKLANENIFIEASSIDGVFSQNTDENEISSLKIFDETISYVKNDGTEMYAKKINFDNKTSIIELVDEVIIIRNDERISGDYGTLDTKNNSYKIKSNNQTKVKVLIQNND